MRTLVWAALAISAHLSIAASFAAEPYSVQELRNDCDPLGDSGLSRCIAYLTAVDDLAIAWAGLVNNERHNVRYAGGYRWCPPADLDFVQWAKVTFEEMAPISGLVDRPGYLYVGMAAQRTWPCPASPTK